MSAVAVATGTWREHWVCKGQGGLEGSGFPPWEPRLTRSQESPSFQRCFQGGGWLLSQKTAAPGCLAAGWLLGIVQTSDAIVQNNVPKPGRSTQEWRSLRCFGLLCFTFWNGEKATGLNNLNIQRGFELSLVLLHPKCPLSLAS